MLFSLVCLPAAPSSLRPRVRRSPCLLAAHLYRSFVALKNLALLLEEDGASAQEALRLYADAASIDASDLVMWRAPAPPATPPESRRGPSERAAKRAAPSVLKPRCPADISRPSPPSGTASRPWPFAWAAPPTRATPPSRG